MEDGKEDDMLIASQPRVPFPYFELLFEIRSQILRYCLIRGKVALEARLSFDSDFPHEDMNYQSGHY